MLVRADHLPIALGSSLCHLVGKMFSLNLLGGSGIEGPQGPLGGRVSQRRRLALLSVLALARERPVSRDKLLALFWPESDSERARHSLADSLYQIRNGLGESAIRSAGEDLWLNPDVVASDVGEFEDALARGDHARAVALYQGPFLDGFFLSDAPEFERWADVERERLDRAHARALEQLAEEASGRGDASGAAEWWRRLAARDPYNSRITLRLMEALEVAGDRAGAIQQARIHATLIAQEFGAEPDAQVEALAARLRTWPRFLSPWRFEADDPDARVAVVPPAVPGEDGAALPERIPIADGAPPAPARRRLIGPRALAVLGALGLGLGAAQWVVRHLPETIARAGATVDSTVAEPRALAVLPCANLSRDPEEEYFSDGLSEELTGVLAQVRALRVVARTSAFAFKGEPRDIREIGRALGVGTLLECSVRRDGERVRVAAQLIDATDGFHLWADTYEREGTDIFAIQSDLALRIADALQAELTPVERARIARRPTRNPEAHTLYQKGRYFWNRRTSSDFARAIDYFEQAIAVDPRYAAAYAGLAMAYSLQGLSGDLPPQEAGERMREAALRALELDEDLAEAHSALAAYLNVYAWDSEASEREYLRALELDPSFGTARHLYGNLLGAMGRLEEAVAQKRKGVELDPLAPQPSNSLGYMLLSAGRSGEAFDAFRNVLELDSTYWQAHAGLGAFYARTGQFEDAIRAHQRAVELAGANPSATGGLARVLALAGRKDEARVLLGEVQAEARRIGIYAPGIAAVLLALDDVEGAFAWLEQSYQQRHPGLRFLGGSVYVRLEGDPRYVDLRRRIGLPAEHGNKAASPGV